jgi:nucleoside-diphosphate-sugar epimerase
MTRILVTGASGFLGGPACAEMLRRGHEVSALVRRPGSQPTGAEPVRGDLTDADSLATALSSLRPEAVVHLAAEIGSQRDRAKIQAVNVRGMRGLLDACEAAGVRRFVFASTVVTGDAGGAVLTEDMPLPVQTAYGASKQEGERMLAASGLEGVVIRPGHIYGPGGWYASEIVARLRQPGRLACVGRGENYWDMVRDVDVACALADGVEHAAPGSVYHCVDDEPLPMRDFLALTARELGVGAPRRVPVALARLLAGRDPVIAVIRSARTSSAKLKRELGWTPRFPTVATGVSDAIAALRR